MELISLKKVNFSYGDTTVIKDLSLSINEEDFICIVGPNGSGKSTLMNGILGLIPIKSGEIHFNVDKNQIGYMPQETSIDNNFPASVLEVVLSGSLNYQKFFYSKKSKKLAAEKLKLLNIDHLSKESFSELSGGQRQKVLLARSLMATKKILFLDEPSNNLDQKSKKDLYRILKKLNDEFHIAIVMITHDLDHENLIGKKILALNDKKAFFGTTADYVRKVHHE